MLEGNSCTIRKASVMGMIADSIHLKYLDTTFMEDEIKALKEEILDVYKPKKIIIFGSSAQGKATIGSDLDICVVTAKNDDLNYARSLILKTVSAKRLPIDWVFVSEKEFQDPESGGVLEGIRSTGRVLFVRN